MEFNYVFLQESGIQQQQNGSYGKSNRMLETRLKKLQAVRSATRTQSNLYLVSSIPLP